MPLLYVVFVLIVAAILLGLLNRYAPDLEMDPKIVKIINVVVIVAVVLWLLSLFIPFGNLNAIRIGRG